MSIICLAISYTLRKFRKRSDCFLRDYIVIRGFTDSGEMPTWGLISRSKTLELEFTDSKIKRKTNWKTKIELPIFNLSHLFNSFKIIFETCIANSMKNYNIKIYKKLKLDSFELYEEHKVLL